MRKALGGLALATALLVGPRIAAAQQDTTHRRDTTHVTRRDTIAQPLVRDSARGQVGNFVQPCPADTATRTTLPMRPDSTRRDTTAQRNTRPCTPGSSQPDSSTWLKKRDTTAVQKAKKPPTS